MHKSEPAEPEPLTTIRQLTPDADNLTLWQMQVSDNPLAPPEPHEHPKPPFTAVDWIEASAASPQASDEYLKQQQIQFFGGGGDAALSPSSTAARRQSHNPGCTHSASFDNTDDSHALNKSGNEDQTRTGYVARSIAGRANSSVMHSSGSNPGHQLGDSHSSPGRHDAHGGGNPAQTTGHNSGHASSHDAPTAAASSLAEQALYEQQHSTTSTNPDKDESDRGYGMTDDRTDTPAATPAQAAAEGDIRPAKGEWVSELIARMWPYIMEAAKRQAFEQLPPLLQQSKPGWMQDIKLIKFELGSTPPRIDDVRVCPSTVPAAEGVWVEFDFAWASHQDVELEVNPAPKVLGSIPLVSRDRKSVV